MCNKIFNGLLIIVILVAIVFAVDDLEKRSRFTHKMSSKKTDKWFNK